MGRPNLRRIAAGESAAALGIAMESPNGFRERLVAFWANHFTVARGKAPYLVGHYVREAIRPHVTGRFEDMLLAVARHPAMIFYLDNQASVGPNSRAGQGGRRGLNENLAREILELHTVTPAARYTQADVTAFAKVITGWSFNGQREPFGFLFRPMAHEPGDKTVMGRIWPEGEEGGVQALAWLARHESTHRHLATKLARHFVADDPPQALIDRLAQAFVRTAGHLPSVYGELVQAPQSWSTQASKLKSPEEFVVSTARLLRIGEALAARSPDAGTAMMGQRIQAAPSPAGWPDRGDEWLGPEAVWKRIEWATRIGDRLGRQIDARERARASLGPWLGEASSLQIERAADGPQALALLLMTPEFQRR
jgi:uncharacterized protein (DUF1800 family)